MIAVDTNVLVYAHRREAPFHDVAVERMGELATGRAKWALPWPCAHEFLAKVTHPRIFVDPTPGDLALAQLEQWLQSPSAETLSEADGYLEVLTDLLRLSAVRGARVHDARIAALCILHGVSELWTVDRDFNRFPLRVRNPLKEG